ncbi:MAG: hypothetical protein Q4A71_05260 [Actinomycetaceae bacterium]|nr:hypothetical protein [Actinomycetaceae bacterium]
MTTFRDYCEDGAPGVGESNGNGGRADVANSIAAARHLAQISAILREIGYDWDGLAAEVGAAWTAWNAGVALPLENLVD